MQIVKHLLLKVLSLNLVLQIRNQRVLLVKLGSRLVEKLLLNLERLEIGRNVFLFQGRETRTLASIETQHQFLDLRVCGLLGPGKTVVGPVQHLGVAVQVLQVVLYVPELNEVLVYWVLYLGFSSSGQFLQ